jgi:hypothetical protein
MLYLVLYISQMITNKIMKALKIVLIKFPWLFEDNKLTPTRGGRLGITQLSHRRSTSNIKESAQLQIS